MGGFLNRGNINFKKDLNKPIYVDMSDMIGLLNARIDTYPYICISRPRRFGKSMMANMLRAYYDCSVDSSSLFEGLAIENDPSFRKHLNQYNVIYMDIAACGAARNVQETMTYIEENIFLDVEVEVYEKHPSRLLKTYLDNKDLNNVLREVTMLTGRGFVFIIDEWDYLFRKLPDDLEGHKDFQHWLSGFLKGQDEYVSLVYMTGILPVKTYGSESILNMFSEKSVVNAGDFARFTGFTEDQVKELCTEYDKSFETMKEWYDGYTVNGVSVYNPNSIVCAIMEGAYQSYWSESSSFEDVKYYISMNYDGLKEKVASLLSGIRIEVDMRSYTFRLNHFKSSDSVLASLVHLGYLTFESRDDDGQMEEEQDEPKLGYVKIPNKEVRGQFELAVKGDQQYQRLFEALYRSESLLDATLAGDEKKVAEEIERAHEHFTSIIKANDENSLACVIGNAYYTAVSKYAVFNEFPSGKGYADITFIPLEGTSDPPMIVELKYNKTAETAIDQIKSRNYQGKLSDGWKEIILVGINYDKENRTEPYTCRIERWHA